MKFQFGGSPRYRHQRQGLRKLIETGGRAALLFDPGLGKSATAIDYASLLALKSETGEARVLVVAPLSVVDGWVDQVTQWISPQVNWWAEALGGSIVDRCETLVARGPEGDKRPRRRPLAWATNDQDFDSSDHGTREALWEAGPTVALPAPRVIFQIVNIDTFKSRLPVPKRKSKLMSDLVLESVRKYQPDLMVVDESHLAKGNSSNSSKLLYRISKHVPRVVLLTGTIFPHSPLDVHAQWRLIDPYAFGQRQPDGSVKEATFKGFQQRFAILERSYAHPGMEVKGFKNLDQLHQVMAERAISVRKEDALDLPPVTDAVVPVHLSDQEEDAYRRMRKDLLAQLDDGSTATASNKLVSLLRLRQITSGFVPSEGDDPHQPHVLGHTKVDVMVDLIRTTLVGEKRVVVFCNFRAEIANLADRLSGDRGLTVETITGDTSSDERILLRKRFASDSDDRIVLICQIQTVSLGINEFVSASHAIFGSLPWQRDQIVQARDRLNRIGQQSPMTFWFCLAEKSIDQVVYQSYLDRSNLEAAVLAHLKEG